MGYPFICPFCIKSTFTKVSSISSSSHPSKDQLASLELKLSEVEVPLANEFEALKNTVEEISCKLEIKEVNITEIDANQSSAPIQPQKQATNKSSRGLVGSSNQCEGKNHAQNHHYI